jgi:hypothetical protein
MFILLPYLHPSDQVLPWHNVSDLHALVGLETRIRYYDDLSNDSEILYCLIFEEPGDL